jgi:HEPN domain-containing protein
MIAVADLRELAIARLKGAETLYAAGQYDTCVYLCGYCIELLLKARICRTLGWRGFPESNTEFQRYASFRTHDLEALLHLSGIEMAIKSEHQNAWKAVKSWEPNFRYLPTGAFTADTASHMLNAVKELLGVI